MRKRTSLTQIRCQIRKKPRGTQLAQLSNRIQQISASCVTDIAGCHVVAIEAVCRAAEIAEGVGCVFEVLRGFVAG